MVSFANDTLVSSELFCGATFSVTEEILNMHSIDVLGIRLFNVFLVWDNVLLSIRLFVSNTPQGTYP